MTPPRPALPEAEYLVRQWMTQTWGDGRYGRVLRRLMTEYDRRGGELGLPFATVLDPGEAMLATDEPCHIGIRAKTCGRCVSLVEAAAARQRGDDQSDEAAGIPSSAMLPGTRVVGPAPQQH